MLNDTTLGDRYLYVRTDDGSSYVKDGEVSDDDLELVKEGSLKIFAVRDGTYKEVTDGGSLAAIQDRTDDEDEVLEDDEDENEDEDEV